MIIIRGIAIVFILFATYTDTCTSMRGCRQLRSTVKSSVIPKNVIAHVGTVARFKCTVSCYKSVSWFRKPYYSKFKYVISHMGEKLLLADNRSSGRLSVEVNSTTGRYDLVIKDIKQSDGGIYFCFDDRGSKHSLLVRQELVVLEYMTCGEDHRQNCYMGENVFGLRQDTISFTCRMRYFGISQPILEWSVGGRKWKATQQQGTIFGVDSSLILAATSKIDGANVTVEAVIGGIYFESSRTPVLWTSDIIRVNYAILENGGVEECPGIEKSVKCNPPCSYKLETVDDTQQCAVSYSAGLCTKWFYCCPISSVQLSEPDLFDAITLSLLVTADCAALIILTVALACYRMKLRFRRKLIRRNVENL